MRESNGHELWFMGTTRQQAPIRRFFPSQHVHTAICMSRMVCVWDGDVNERVTV